MRKLVYLKVFIALIVIAVAGSLPGKSGFHIAVASDEPQAGIISKKVVCKSNPEQSYAVYLPSTYSASRKWPLIAAFDPAARGNVPVEQFKDAAERYGYIVCGSNNSRNGPLQPSAEAAKAMLAWSPVLRAALLRLGVEDVGNPRNVDFSCEKILCFHRIRTHFLQQYCLAERYATELQGGKYVTTL